MAFTEAKVVRFEKHRTPAPEALVERVFVAVIIHDDAAPVITPAVPEVQADPANGIPYQAPVAAVLETKYAEYWCTGEDLVALQAITDPVAQAEAAKAWLAAKVAETHAAWVTEMAVAKPTKDEYDATMLETEFGATSIDTLPQA